MDGIGGLGCGGFSFFVAGLFLVVKTLSDFFGVALVVESKKPVEYFEAGGFADGETDALLRKVEVMGEIEVLPVVGSGDGLIHFDVELSKFGYILGSFVGIVESVVGFGESFLASLHDGLAMGVVSFANFF